ncbi:MAG TPA: ATP synthase F1 subunit delta [Polyangiaceae bacterium]|nr:ATP synthase F1 subunit delta [Polyangiaceae bacterium]
MSLETIAARYAEAVYELGIDGGNLPKLAQEFGALAEAYRGVPDLRAALESPLVDERSRQGVLADLGDRLGLDPVTRNTLGLLAARHRLVLLPHIARALGRLSDQRAGVERAQVTSAAPLPVAFLERLAGELSRSTSKKVVVEHRVDPSLIGGIVTRIGDQVIDGSVRSRLHTLRRGLLAGGAG